MTQLRAILGSLILLSFPVFAQSTGSAPPTPDESAIDTLPAQPSEARAETTATDTDQTGADASDGADELRREEHKREVIRRVLEDAKAQPDYTPTPPPPTPSLFDQINR